MPDLTQPVGFRFAPGGVNLRSTPDAIPPTKYASAANIRWLSDNSVQVRPGYDLFFDTAIGAAVTDVQMYASLGNNDRPRILARNNANNIVLDSGANVATMSGAAGSGASMIPFRPSASPEAWMYVASLEDYIKLSAPGAIEVVTTAKVGIAEPQTECEAVPVAPAFTDFSGLAAGWAQTGTAGALTNVNLTSDTVALAFADPVIATRFSCTLVSAGSARYVSGQEILINGTTKVIMQKVIPRTYASIKIESIYYFAGAVGRCIIVPKQIPVGEQTPIAGETSALPTFQRGGLITLSGNGGETAMVLNVTDGPQGTLCLECVTQVTQSTSDTIAGVDTFIIDNATITGGTTITTPMIHSAITTGLGIFTRTLGTNPFAVSMGSSDKFPQADDYVNLEVAVVAGAFTDLTTIQVVFKFGAFTIGSYSTSAALLSPTFLNTALISFQIGQLSHDNPNFTLTDCDTVVLNVTCAANLTLDYGGLWVGGGSQPDIGADGTPYFYRAVPRSTLTGAKGNASPPMRYGVSPRRQSVTVTVPSSSYDTQINIWDIFREGGSVTSQRYIGSVVPGGTFTDDFTDAAALAGSLLETDNFEPWPSIDLPFSQSAGVSVVGTIIVLTSIPAVPARIMRWLPGTLIQIGGLNVYTLRARPTKLSGNSYLFEIQENGGTSTGMFSIAEPNVAREPVPLMWGPDSQGTLFAVGDALRPGVSYFSKAYNPDSAPDTYSIELCAPPEPLMGGEVKDGVSFVASTLRWWALYSTFNDPTRRYTPIEQPVGRGLVSGYGHCTDGVLIYFWAVDGIWSTNGKSLTDADLYNLFPHEGIPGVDVVRGDVTYYAPDYQRAQTFRLSKVNSYLYADYRDKTNTQRTMVCDLRTGGWVQDVYADQVCGHFQVPKQKETADLGTDHPTEILFDIGGKVWRQRDRSNDDIIPISARLATFEWDGGSQRNNGLWYDFYVDCIPSSTLTITPVQFGVQAAIATVVPVSGRVLAQVTVEGGALSRFLGLHFSWDEDFGADIQPTKLIEWKAFCAPDTVTVWRTQYITHGMMGYQHCGRIEAAYSSTADVNLSIACFDGTSPATITLPATGGVFKKLLVTPTFNKGQLYQYMGTSSAPFQFYLQDMIFHIGQWGRAGQYVPFRLERI